MAKELFTDDEILIHAPIAKVWDALINPKITPEYMFTCAVESDWQLNQPVLWRGIHDGVLYVKGNLVAFQKEKELSYTVFDPNAGYEDVPENYLVVTCSLKAQEDGVLLRIRQGDYNAVVNGAERYAETMAGGGWKEILKKIGEITS